MLTIEVKINGILITAIDCVNTGHGDPRGKQAKTIYKYRAVTFPADWRKPPLIAVGDLAHRYEDGGNKLAQLLIAKAPK